MQARIGMVDDHPAVVLGVTAMLNAQPDLRVVGAAGTVSSLLSSGHSFDLVLLDLALPDGSTPAENMARLADLQAPVIAFTSGEAPQLVRDAARAGVAAMVRKSESPHQLVGAIRAVLRGEPVATPDWASALSEDRAFVDASLSKREAEVLGLYASGETAARVAEALFISRETVLDHVRNIRQKYASVGREAPTRVDLFRRAVEDGLVEPEV